MNPQRSISDAITELEEPQTKYSGPTTHSLSSARHRLGHNRHIHTYGLAIATPKNSIATGATGWWVEHDTDSNRAMGLLASVSGNDEEADIAAFQFATVMRLALNLGLWDDPLEAVSLWDAHGRTLIPLSRFLRVMLVYRNGNELFILNAGMQPPTLFTQKTATRATEGGPAIVGLHGTSTNAHTPLKGRLVPGTFFLAHSGSTATQPRPHLVNACNATLWATEIVGSYPSLSGALTLAI